MMKFDQLRTHISETSASYAKDQEEMETKKMERDLLATQIENLKLHETKREKTKATIDDERQRLQKQVQTLTGLSQALETQLKNS